MPPEYPHTKDSVEHDAKHSIDLLIEEFPRRWLRCAYSGKCDDPEIFYTAANGRIVRNSQVNKLRADGWLAWLPREIT